MLPKTCQYCYHAKEATGSSRTILICDHKYGCEAKFFVVAPKASCKNFNPGRINFPIRRSPSLESDEVRYIPLTQGGFAIVDAEDYDRLAKYKWYRRQDGNTFYAFRHHGWKGRKIIMHRGIMRAPKGLIVDHIDGNGLNNRKSNLRLCSATENARNRRPVANCHSRYKGVTWDKNQKKWQVRISDSGKCIYLGRFDNEMEAAIAYDRKAEQLFAEFAYLNFGKKRISD